MAIDVAASIAEFEAAYAARSGVTVDWLHEHGRWGAPCDCGDDTCEGFQMLHCHDEVDVDDLDRRGLLQYVGGAGA